MSIEFVDSFDHYGTSDIDKKYDAVGGSPAINASGGQNSTGGIEFDAASEYAQKNFSGNLATAYVGIAVKCSTLGSNQDVLRFMDSTSTQVKIRIRTDGKVEAFRDITSLGVSASAVITANTYAYLEARATIDDAAGVVHIKVNGVDALNLTAQDTKATANAYTTSFRIGGDGGLTVTMDNLYALNTTGSAPQNTFLGVVRVDKMLPASEGLYSGFTPSAGSDNALMVDDAAADGDSTYNSSAAVGTRDSFVMNPVVDVGGALIFGVQVVSMARKDGSGTRKIRNFLRVSGTNYAGASQNLGTTYFAYRDIFETNPATALPWAEVEVNGAEEGYEVAS